MNIDAKLATDDPNTYDVHIATDGETVYLRLVGAEKSWESKLTADEAHNVAAVLQVAAEAAAPADLAEE